MSRAFKRSANTEVMETDQEWMILHADRYTVTKLNEVGSYCWMLLEMEQTVESLAEGLQRRYEVDSNIAMGDVRSFLDHLEKLGLVEYAS